MRSGTSRMNSTQTSASTANGTATRKMWPVASPKACSNSVAHRRRQRARGRGSVAVAEPPPAVIAQRAPGRAATRVGDLVAEHRAQRRDADRAAHRAEERDDRAGRAHVGLGGVVLHREHEVLHGGAEAEAEHRHEGADHARRLVVSSIVDEQRRARR